MQYCLENSESHVVCMYLMLLVCSLCRAVAFNLADLQLLDPSRSQCWGYVAKKLEMENLSGNSFAFYRPLGFVGLGCSLNIPNFSQLSLIPGELRRKNLPSEKSLIFDPLRIFSVVFVNSCLSHNRFAGETKTSVICRTILSANSLGRFGSLWRNR